MILQVWGMAAPGQEEEEGDVVLFPPHCSCSTPNAKKRKEKVGIPASFGVLEAGTGSGQQVTPRRFVWK